jgi:hypothetical protein
MKNKRLSLNNLPDVFYFEKDFDISAEGRELDRLMEFLNLHWLGSKDVNKYDGNGHLVPIYTPEQEKPLRELHWRANAGCLQKMKIGFNKHMEVVSIEKI